MTHSKQHYFYHNTKIIIYLQRVFQGVIQFHDSCLITTAVAVVRGAENRYHIAIMAPIVTLGTKGCIRLRLSTVLVPSQPFNNSHVLLTNIMSIAQVLCLFFN